MQKGTFAEDIYPGVKVRLRNGNKGTVTHVHNDLYLVESNGILLDYIIGEFTSYDSQYDIIALAT